MTCAEFDLTGLLLAIGGLFASGFVAGLYVALRFDRTRWIR